MAESREFLEEPHCWAPLGLTVDIELKTRCAMNFARDHAPEMTRKLNEVQTHLKGIRVAAASSSKESGEFESDVVAEDDGEYLSTDGNEQNDEDSQSDDANSLSESECDLDASDDLLRPETLPSAPVDIPMFTANLEGVQHEFSSLCMDLDMKASMVVPIWTMWIGGTFNTDIVDVFGQPPIEVWRKICSCSLFKPLLTIMERLFAIPSSQAFCERALWHLRRILLPSSLNTGPDLTLARLQAVLSPAKWELSDLTLRSSKSDKVYHLSVYPGETIRDIKTLLADKYGLSGQEIWRNNSPREVLNDDRLIEELDLS
jgi:hypothetical protein